MYECARPVGEEVFYLIIRSDILLTAGDSGGTLLEGFGISCTNS